MMPQQYPTYAMPPQQRRRTASDVIPGALPGLLGGLQLILWLAIIGLEATSVYYDAGRGTIYAGFWCAMPYFITWVSMFCFRKSLSLVRLSAFLTHSLILVCCGHTNGCGIYLVVINTISAIFSIVLIVYTTEFVKNPCRCYGYLCSIPPWDSLGNWNTGDEFPWITSECTLRTLEKLPYLKGLLGGAVLMLLSNLVYSVVYIAVSIRLQCKENGAANHTNVTFQKQQGSVNFSHQQSYPQHVAAYPSHPSAYHDGYRQSAPPPPYSQEYFPSAPPSSFHDGYRQAPAKQPMPYSRNDYDDDDRF